RESAVVGGQGGQGGQGSFALAPHSSLLVPRSETPQWLLKLKESVKQDK
ncbi:MCE family protein, partial [Chroococcidiopsis cubana CCALA 043]